MEVALINKKNQRWIFLGLILFYFSIGAITLLLSERKLISILDTLPVTCPLRKFTGFLCSFCGIGMEILLNPNWLIFYRYRSLSARLYF
jgi:hypothetical protein